MVTEVPAATGSPSRLVGRADDLDRTTALLRAHRLVTVTGVGGVGKTTLATAVAASHGGRVVTCSLGDVEQPSSVRHLVAARLGTTLPDGVPLGAAVPPERDGRDVVVVLDNCEHLLDAAADVAGEILTAGDHVRVLATSREPLGTAGENVVVLGPLTVPASALDHDAAARDAVVLFADRVRAVRDDFVLDARTLPHVVDICRALDGLPLALEIAAARARSLAVADIAARLGERFSLLSRGARGGPSRHHGLRSVVAWSYDLLSPAEQVVFDELSVPPSCDLAAAMGAAAAVGSADDPAIDVLDGLVAKSLLLAETGSGTTRYRMLETLRAFGNERLRNSGRLEAARDRHADRYATLADDLRALGLVEWSQPLRLLISEFDNFRTALDWTLTRDVTAERSLRLLAPLWYVGLQTHAQEIADLADRALDRWPVDDNPLRSEVYATASACRLALEDPHNAARLARAAIAAGTSEVAAAWGLATLAGVALHTDGDPAAALEHLAAADGHAAAAGFEPFRCDLLGRQVGPLAQAGRRDEAMAVARRALSLAGTQGNVFEHAWATHLVGELLGVDRPEEGRGWLLRALEESRRIEYPFGTASSLRALGVVGTRLGDAREAASRFADALDAFVGSGFRLERRNTLAALLPLLRDSGHRELAVEVAADVARSGVVVERIVAPTFDADLSELAAEADQVEAWSADAEHLVSRVRHALRDIAAGAGGDEQAAAVPRQRQETTASLRRSGDLWTATYGSRTVHLPDLKGLSDLAVLLERPGREVAALDLAAGAAVPDGRPRADHGELRVAGGDLGEQVDAPARAAYSARIRDLQQEVDDADATGDPERSTRAQGELDRLTRHLAAAYGLHGPRRAGDPAEKARTAVTARVRAAIGKVGQVHPALGRHLDRSVRTGRFCAYLPDEPVTWTVQV